MKKQIAFYFFLFTLNCIAQTHYVSNLDQHGSGSLRDVILKAPENSTIRFEPSLLDNGSQTLTLDSNILINKNLTVKGLVNGEDTLFISGGDSTRVFNIIHADSVMLDSLVIQNGFTSENGGGIFASHIQLLTINNSIIRNCSAENGGGIYGRCSQAGSVSNYYQGNDTLSIDTSATLSILNTYVHNNSATFNGGGIYYSSRRSFTTISQQVEAFVSSLLQIHSSTVSNNNAEGYGGGIYHVASSTTVSAPETTTPSPVLKLHTFAYISINTSSIFHNESQSGGGICNTISTNHISMNKGGRADHFNKTKVDFKNSTSYENQAEFYPEIQSYSSAINGMATAFSKDLLNIESSIIGNTQPNAFSIGTENQIQSLGYNIFSDSIVLGNHTTDHINISPQNIKLNNPACYGESRTPTLQPLTPSLAINSGSPNDFSNAQTGGLFGRRDIGAAETCESFIIEQRTENNYLIWYNDSLYTSDNSTATYTIENEFGCDSIIYLDLKIIPSSEISVYPNPVKNSQNLEIFLGNHINTDYSVQLLNLQGKIIESYSITKKHNNLLKLTNLKLDPGIYFVKNDHSKKSVKIIVQ